MNPLARGPSWQGAANLEGIHLEGALLPLPLGFSALPHTATHHSLRALLLDHLLLLGSCNKGPLFLAAGTHSCHPSSLALYGRASKKKKKVPGSVLNVSI